MTLCSRPRSIVASALLLVLIGTVVGEAQTTKLSISRRQVVGIQEYATPDVVQAADLPTGAELLFISLDLTNAARTDPATFVRLNFFSSGDNGQTWQPIGGITFRGDPTLPNTAVIGVGVGASAVVGKRVKAQIDVPVQTAVGVSVLVGTEAELGF